MKKSVGLISKLFAATSLIFAVLFITSSCSKSSSDTMAGMNNNTTGTTGAAGEQSPGGAEQCRQNLRRRAGASAG